MAIRFEVWTRPESGAFARLFPITTEVAFNLSLGMFGQGAITLPADYDRLDEILYSDLSDHSNDVGTLIRAFRDDDWVYDFYATRLIMDINEMGSRTATVSGGGLGTILSRTILFPYDYDVNPTVQPRWEYGADNKLLDNPDFEDEASDVFSNGSFDDGKVTPWSALSGTDTNALDADLETTTSKFQAGTHSLEIDPGKRHSGAVINLQGVPGEELTIDGYVNGTAGRRITCAVKAEDGMSFASTNGYIYNGWHIVEIGNTAANSPPDGLPGGSLTGGATWDALGTLKVTPGTADDETSVVKYTVQDDHHNNSNGPIFWIDSFTGTGVGIGLDPWMSHNLTAMELDTVAPLAGLQSAKVTGPDQSSLYQDIDGMVVGATYTFYATVYHEEGVAKDIIAEYNIQGNASALTQTSVSVPDSTETVIAVTWTAIQENARVEIKNDSGGAITWWIDTTSAGPGLSATTFGEIMGDVHADAATDHAPGRTTLDFLTLTFTDALDTDTAAWDQDVSLSLNMGQTYRRILTYHGDRFGYEYDMHPASGDLTDIEWDLFNPEGLGTDLSTGDGGAILPVGVVSLGPIIRREPLASYAFVEGGDQFWGEDTNATIETAWGQTEVYDGSDEVLLANLAGLAGNITVGTDAETVVVTFVEPTLIPGVDYKRGDIVNLRLGDDYVKSATYRVVAIDIQSGDLAEKYQVQFIEVI